MTKLSIVVITQNEANMIVGCLESAQWADEIIVIDNFSTDKTVTLTRKYTRKIYKHRFTGFADQKNYGISKAKNEWIFVLDADERISQQLRVEIEQVITDSAAADIYDLPRVNYFLGRRMNYGGWQHDRVERLFKQSKTKYADQQIHEYLLKNKGQSVGHLTQPLYHFSHRDIGSNLLKTKQYAEWDAHYHYVRKSPLVTRWSLLKGTVEHFWFRYVREKGYRDGMEGFIEAMYQAFSYILIIQSMLWEKQRGKSSVELYKELDCQLKLHDFSFEND